MVELAHQTILEACTASVSNANLLFRQLAICSFCSLDFLRCTKWRLQTTLKLACSS
ncbi:hypothetical protein Plhal304r1_c062g0148941 [Plasmopara halstedii]